MLHYVTLANCVRRFWDPFAWQQVAGTVSRIPPFCSQAFVHVFWNLLNPMKSGMIRWICLNRFWNMVQGFFKDLSKAFKRPKFLPSQWPLRPTCIKRTLTRFIWRWYQLVLPVTFSLMTFGLVLFEDMWTVLHLRMFMLWIGRSLDVRRPCT